MRRKTRILFIRPAVSPFIENDLALLEKHFEVRVVDVMEGAMSRANLKGTVILLRDVALGMQWADVSFSWFAQGYARLAVLLSRACRKKSIVVTGGFDVADEPSIDYGVMRFPKSRNAKTVRYALENADVVLPFSNFSKLEVLKHSRPKALQVVYCGVDTEEFKPDREKADDLVITVGGVNSVTLKRKGLETFVRSAHHLPATKFVLIGKHVDDSVGYLRSIATPNVEFTGFVSSERLLEYLRRAKVYVQVSAQEGFGVSLAEAMLCRCVPVVTDRGAIPEVVGDTGYYVPYGDPEATAQAIQKALRSDKGEQARERIAAEFPLHRREAELVRMINELR